MNNDKTSHTIFTLRFSDISFILDNNWFQDSAEHLYTLHACRLVASIIRQHDNAVCLCRDGGGGLHSVIQWKTAASVLQSGNWAIRTLEPKVCTMQKTTIPILSRENAPASRKRPWHFAHCIIFFFSNSSSPSAVAHERWGVWKRYI